MDCRTAHLLLSLARHGSSELAASELQAVGQHLDTCADCRALARTLRADEEQLRQAMVQVPIPDGLRTRIHARLADQRATTLRLQRRRRYALLAAAAVVLLTTTGSAFWWVRQRPALDLDVVLLDAREQFADAEAVAGWYAQKYRMRTVAPTEFNYSLLASCSLGIVQGRRVPELVFVRGSIPCRVWILSERYFDLQQALNAARVSSGGYTVEIRQHPTVAGVAYLIVYPGDSLEPFLDQPRQAT